MSTKTTPTEALYEMLLLNSLMGSMGSSSEMDQQTLRSMGMTRKHPWLSSGLSAAGTLLGGAGLAASMLHYDGDVALQDAISSLPNFYGGDGSDGPSPITAGDIGSIGRLLMMGAPLVLGGLGKLFGGVRPMTEEERLAQMTPEEREHAELGAMMRARTKAALKGELPVEPALERQLNTEKQEATELLARKLGPDWQLSTPGIQTMGDLEERAERLRAASRHDELSTGLGNVLNNQSFLSGLQNTQYTQRQNFGMPLMQQTQLLGNLLGQQQNLALHHRGLGIQNRGLDMQMQMFQQQMQMMADAQRRQGRNSLLGGVGKLAGTGVGAFFGGPMGAGIGGMAGGALGGLS